MDPLELILVGRPDKHTYVSSLLSKEEKEQLRQVLLDNIDVFDWTHSDMTDSCHNRCIGINKIYILSSYCRRKATVV